MQAASVREAINLTNNTNLDGRTIMRQQSKVQANRNFAMNR